MLAIFTKRYWLLISCILTAVLTAEAQQYVVTGGKGTPMMIENKSQHIQVYVLNGLDNAEIKYTSNSNQHRWFRYNTKKLESEPVTSTQSGNSSSIRNFQEGYGYYVKENGVTDWIVWVIDYSKHAFQPNKINVKGDCSSFWLEGEPKAERLAYSGINGENLSIDRTFDVSFNNLVWSEEDKTFTNKTLTETIKGDPFSATVNHPILMDTEVTLSGDQFARHFGIDEPVTSETYQAVAIEMHADTVVTTIDADNMTLADGSTAFCAPLDVHFKAIANDPVASLYIWKIYRSDDEEGSENPLIHFTGEEIDYTFSEEGKFTAEVQVSDRSGLCSDIKSFDFEISDAFLDVPNAFSPGTTPGINDEFKVAYRSLTKYNCWIFNRWGVKMFDSSNPAEGWDGKKNGKYVAPGVYFYVIEAVGSDNKNYKKKGAVTILRSKKIEDEIIEEEE